MKDIQIFAGAGHGGLHPLTGEYLTPGKRHDFGVGTLHDGSVFYEGVSNRAILDCYTECARLMPEYEYHIVSHPWEDTPLRDRVRFVNSRLRKGAAQLYTSFHSDWIHIPQVNGYAVWTSRGLTQSDKAAELVYEELIKLGFNIRRRNGRKEQGGWDYEANFFVVFYTHCPAQLGENGYMSNWKDAHDLLKLDFQRNLALAYYRAALRFTGGDLELFERRYALMSAGWEISGK